MLRIIAGLARLRIAANDQTACLNWNLPGAGNFRKQRAGQPWLSAGDGTEEIQILRRNVEKGLPCGSVGFVQELGKLAGRLLEYRPQGRPRSKIDDGNKG